MPVLLVIDPFLGRHVLFAAVLLELPVALLFEAHLRLRSPALYSQRLRLFVNLSVTLPGIDDKEVLFGPSGVGVVDEQAAAEATPHRARRDKLHLLRVFRVPLQDSPPAAHQTSIQGREKCKEAAIGVCIRAVGVAQPLDS